MHKINFCRQWVRVDCVLDDTSGGGARRTEEALFEDVHAVQCAMLSVAVFFIDHPAIGMDRGEESQERREKRTLEHR